MRVTFLKNCPWSYKLTKGQKGPIVKHKEGETCHIIDVEANAMIDAGYAKEAIEVHKPQEKKKRKRKVRNNA